MSHKKELGQYMTPEEVAGLMAVHFSTPLDEAVVLDPACGDGNLLIAVAQEMIKLEIDDIETRLVGMDVDPTMVEMTRKRLSRVLNIDPSLVDVRCADFLKDVNDNLFGTTGLSHINCIISNPPYGALREYKFFEACQELNPNVETVFLLPMAFADRVDGPDYDYLPGRPLGVTTGHVIAHHVASCPYTIRSTRGPLHNLRGLAVLSGIKLYEVGSGTPKQTRETVQNKPYSSCTAVPGWLPCLRTGDIEAYRVKLGRLWVKYGEHLAHPKEIQRFVGPKLFVRRMPTWEGRRLTAAFSNQTILCAGDVLVVRHESDDALLLKGVERFLNSPEASEAVLSNRPSVLHRVSFPKIAAKDLNRLFDNCLPDDDALRALGVASREDLIDAN